MSTKIEGFVTVAGVTDANGNKISTQKAVEYGWLPGNVKKPAGWGISREEVPLGYNMTVDNGRQFMAYLFGGRLPLANFTCSKFGIGTGTTAPNSAQTALINPIAFNNGDLVKSVTEIDFPAPFIARVHYTIPADEANIGALITETGLYAADSDGVTTLLCRKRHTGIPKNADWGPSLLWRIRF